MKIIYGFLCFILLLSGCVKDNPDTPIATPSTLESDYLGKYICSSEYHSDEWSVTHPELVPAITFYENGICEVKVNYLGGVCDVEGVYTIYDESIEINLDLKGTIFESESDEKYMNDQYIFEIIDENTIKIDRGFYTVNSGDLFIRLSSDDGLSTSVNP